MIGASPSRRAIGIALLFVVAAGVGGALAQDSDPRRAFEQNYRSPNTWVRYDAVRTLDPNDPSSVDLLLRVLERDEWYVRLAAMDVLAGASDERCTHKLERGLSGSDATVAEGVALSHGKRLDPAFIPALVEALGHRRWQVRRSAAYALARMPDRQSVGPLIAAWAEEREVRAAIQMQIALETITGQFLGREPEAWQSWWTAVGNTWQVGQGQTREERERAEQSGNQAHEFTTRTRDVDLNYRTRGNGTPLFVIPEYGFNRNYLETYLRPLEEHARIFYIDLPGVSEFRNLPPSGVQGIPVYPIDQLCNAFDEIRQREGIERIAIMGHGISNWIAMRYATQHPANVAGLIMVCPYSSGQAWASGRDRIEGAGRQSGDQEMEHYAQNLLVNPDGTSQYEPQSQEEGAALGRKQFTLYFADPRDSEIGLIYFGGLDPTADPSEGGVMRRLGQCLVPMDFNVGREAQAQVPVLICYGAVEIWTAAQDIQQIQRHYPRSAVVPFERSRRMPFIEENDRFTETLARFLD